MSIVAYLARRIMLAALVILGVLLITFVVSHVVPGDPARLYAGSRAGEEALAEVRQELGLDQPLPRQFLRYVLSSARGDFGYSYRTKRPILDDLKVRLPATMELVILATLLAVIVGIPTGVLAAARFGTGWTGLSAWSPSRKFRRRLLAGAPAAASVLSLARMAAARRAHRPRRLLYRSDHDDHGLRPRRRRSHGQLGRVARCRLACNPAAVVLATFPYSLVVRMTRASMLEVLSETYIAAARAAGLSEWEILFKLALKNAIVPTLTVMGLASPFP